MLDIDTPVVLEEKAPLPIAMPPSKRPRDDGSPVRGKRGKRAAAAFSLPVPAKDGDFSASSISPFPYAVSQPAESNPVSPPLCESPSKINQARSPFAPFSGGEAAKPRAGSVGGDAFASASAADTVAAATRRKSRVPRAAPPSMGATDPIFQAALLRLLYRRNGEHCPEAVGWRWGGDTPARFDHWPCALHPVVMDLLACVSAGEERVVMTACDKQRGGGAGGCCDGGADDNPRPPREAAWRAPRPRTPLAHRGAPAGAPTATTPIAAPSPCPAPARTPLSALRRPGSPCRLSSKNRVRFSTHDMSVVDTPDPQRGGSEESMLSALDGLESILAAAQRVRDLAARGSPVAAFSDRGDGDRQYEGYYDRFSAAGGQPDGGDEGATATAPEPAARAAEALYRVVGKKAPGLDEGFGQAAGEGEADEHQDSAAMKEMGDDVDACLSTEAKSVREDVAAFVDVLEQIASSDSAPDEVSLAGGWGPEHSNAAAFYAKELTLLCRAGDQANSVPLASGMGGANGSSHLRGRYLDVLSCLIRYNLKLLLNVCECDPPEEEDATVMVEVAEGDDGEEAPPHAAAPEAGDDDDDDDVDGEVSADDENKATGPTVDLPSPFSSPSTAPATAGSALTVIVPGRAALLREQGLADAAWGSSAMAKQQATTKRGLCGCVSVLDDKGALEFNNEDVAALLTLALGRVHPFMPLAARISAAAEDAGWDGSASAGDETGHEAALDARVWAAVQQYTLECRAASSAVVPATAAAAAASPTQLFSSPVSAGAMPPPPPPPRPASGRESAGRAGGPAVATVGSPRNDGVTEQGNGGKGGVGAVDGGEVPASIAPSPSPTVSDHPNGGGFPAAAAQVEEVELTVDEATDLLEFVAAARFIAQLIAEPVVSAGISAGRWAYAMRLAEQVQKLAEEEQAAKHAAATTAVAAPAAAAAASAAPTSSLSNALCLGALADVKALGLTMAQHARYAPAMEAALRRELRQALRRGQGLKRRIRHRLHQGVPEVFSFPLVMPACQLIHHGVSCDAV